MTSMTFSTFAFASSRRSVYIALGLSLAVLVLMYGPTAASMAALWAKDPLAHGYLVIPVAMYLAWGTRHDLESLSTAPAFWALPLLGLIAFLWLLGNLTDTGVIQQVCLVAMCIGFVWGMLGSSAARMVLFPLGFLVFALPLGDRLIPTLQDFTARFAVKMLSLSGVPVLLRGHVISIPGGEWQVAEACSGINYLMSSLAIGYLYAGTTYRYWTHRVGFLAASALLPLVANGLRVYATILIASLGGTSIVAGTRHYLFGWLIFAGMMGLLFVICGRWSEEPPESQPTSRGTGPGVTPTRTWSPVLFATLGLLLVGIAPVSAKLYWRQVGTDAWIRLEPPTVASPWEVAGRDPYRWTPRFVAPSAEFVQSYDSGDSVVKVYVAYYSSNQPGVKLASVANVLFEQPWVAAAERHVDVILEGQSFQARETDLQSPESALLVWSWYWVNGTPTGNDYVAKILLAKARLVRSPRGSAAIAIATEDRPGTDAATTLRNFLQHLAFARMGE